MANPLNSLVITQADAPELIRDDEPDAPSRQRHSTIQKEGEHSVAHFQPSPYMS